jgi:hypothetical protein
MGRIFENLAVSLWYLFPSLGNIYRPKIRFV